jgi:putative restriction endonuclease
VPKVTRKNWTSEETILAFALYCKTPFGKIDHNNPVIIELASIIGRTPSAISMKMCNFGRFDSERKKRNVAGLKNGSKLDETIWNEFSQNGESLVTEAAIIMARYTSRPVAEQVDMTDLPDLPEGEEKDQIVKTRLNQQFFREALLSSYNSACCVTGINISELLIASHIKPWRVSDPKTERTKPSNGLLLNALHDKAFDKGFISINPSFEILVSSKLSGLIANKVIYDWFLSFQGKQITLPEKFIPEKEFIEYHNDVIFLR